MEPREFWPVYGERLRRHILRRVRHDHDAEDILQDVFARIQTAWRDVVLPEKTEAWVFQIARRAIVDHYRRRRTSGLSHDPAGPEPLPPVGKELASCLPGMLRRLDDLDRETLRLVDQEDLPQKDLAMRLGLSPTGAKSRVQRARQRLKALLLDCCDVELDRRGNAVDYAPRRPCSCG